MPGKIPAPTPTLLLQGSSLSSLTGMFLFTFCFKATELFVNRPALKQSLNLCVHQEAKSTTTVDADLVGKGKG